MAEPAIHTFDNGVRIYDHHLLDVQRARYRRRNVHEEDEEDLFLATLTQLPPNGVFLNVGAAVGYYAILAKLKRPDLIVHAVEPLPGHIQRFKENLLINGLGSADFRLHEIAIAATDEKVAPLLDDSYGSRLLDSAEARGRLCKSQPPLWHNFARRLARLTFCKWISKDWNCRSSNVSLQVQIGRRFRES